MNKFTFLVFLFTIIFLASSCSDDDYSVSDFTVNMATVVDTSSAFYLKLDNGEKLWVTSPQQIDTPKSDRVIINYTLLSDAIKGFQAIKINGIKTVLTKDIVYIAPTDITEQDIIGYDPINVLSISQGSDYLNIKFGFNFGENQQHLVSMIADEPNFDVSISPIKMQFRHNQNNDPQLYPVQDYVCFNLKPYKDAALLAGLNKLEFQVRVLNLKNEEKNYSIEYKIVE